MASANVPDPLTPTELAASRMMALRGALEDLERAIARKGVKRIRENVIQCRKREAELAESRGELETSLMEDCEAELRSLEEKAVELASQYYDENIQDIESLLKVGGEPPDSSGSKRTKSKRGPQNGPVGRASSVAEESLPQDGGNSSTPREDEESGETHNSTLGESRSSGASESFQSVGAEGAPTSQPSPSAEASREGGPGATATPTDGRLPRNSESGRTPQPLPTDGTEANGGPRTQGDPSRSQRRRERRRGRGRSDRTLEGASPPLGTGRGSVETGHDSGQTSRANRGNSGRGRGTGGSVTPFSSTATGRSSGASRRTPKSSEIIDRYSTKRVDPDAVYPETWSLPSEEEFRAKYTKYDIGKTLRTHMISKFTGKPSDYVRFKASFFVNIHVQREPAHIKAGALDSLMDPEVREEIFGIYLGNSEFYYAERLERLERRFGGEERMIDLSLNKIKALRSQSRKDYSKLRELVDVIHFYIRGIGRRDANSCSLREHLREGMPPNLLRRYMEETEEKGLEDTLAHLLEWTHRNVSMYFKHKEFEEAQAHKREKGLSQTKTQGGARVGFLGWEW